MKNEHKAPKEYTKGVQKKKETQTHSHLYPIQVKNPTKEFKLSTLYNLAHDHNVNKKTDFILWAEGASFSKATLFLSFHSVQNIQRGAANQTLFRFLPTLALCQVRRGWRTVRGNTQLESVMTKKRSHNILALEQWISKWSIVSSFFSHKKHMFTRGIPLPFSWSRVSTLPQEASQAKKPIFGGTIGFHMEEQGKSVGRECISLWYMCLTKKTSVIVSFDTSQSS